MESVKEAINDPGFLGAVEQRPPPPGLTYSYGTAGFRMKAELLPCAVFRVGLLAAARSIVLGGAPVGVMITASHNPLPDNGVKIVDPSGGMLPPDWEARAASLANAPFAEVAPMLLEWISTDANAADASAGAGAGAGANHASANASAAGGFRTHGRPRVLVARDTRPSGAGLVSVLSEAVSLTSGSVVDLGEMTTPQLHWMVAASANKSRPVAAASLERYMHELSDTLAAMSVGAKSVPRDLRVDAANGIGGPAMDALAEVLGDSPVRISVRNDGRGDSDVLNEGCGSDFVKVGQCAPRGVELAAGSAADGTVHASFDGDADRVVCYHRDASGAFRLLDGDKILALFALFVKKQLEAAGIEQYVKVLGVQTAYANGASTRYLQETLGIETAFTQTGVKNLHHRALECQGVSAYFEANGHGTVLFGPAFHRAIDIARPGGLPDPAARKEGHAALRRLRALSALINPYVGDAITDAVAVVAVLACLDWTSADWDAIYEDMPNKLDKVGVRDRTAIHTADADRVVTEPAALQADIDAAVAKAGAGARSFVRPSGTEDVVRIYAEAESKEAADALCAAVKDLVVKHLG